MLTYLDSLCDAMVARDLPRLHNLVDDHPLVRLLPAEAMSEVRRFLAQKVGRHAVPLMTLRFRDQTARLLGEPTQGPGTSVRSVPAPMVPVVPRRRRGAAIQTELPLSA
jgi:hypothetical protein